MRFQSLSFLLLVLNASAPAATVIGGTGFIPPAEQSIRGEKVSKVAQDHPALDAINAFNKGQHTEALKAIGPLAKEGNPEALLVMGLAYQDGRGVEASPEKAIEYVRKAKAFGNEQAAYLLPKMLIKRGDAKARDEASRILEELARTDKGAAEFILGEGALRGWFGGDPDFESTRLWWLKSAEKGEIKSMLALARLFDGEFGFPEERDPAAALEQFLKAASLGNSTAMVAAGARLLSGDASIRDEKLGRDWLQKAIEAKQYDAYLVLGDYEQSAKESEAALENYRKGAENGQPVCMIKLGNLLIEGAGGLEKNPEAALSWFKKAGESGIPFGHILAARMMLKQGDDSEVLEGYGYLVAAAESGSAEAQNEIGMLYLTGRLGTRDGTAAAAWFARAGNAGLANATYNLATLIERGYGVPKNPGEAGRLYTMAANTGHPQATAALGRLHAKGLGTERDLPKAWALFSLAIEHGDKESEAPLEELTAGMTTSQIEEARRQLAEIRKVGKKVEADD